jgi:hypothetical protein
MSKTQLRRAEVPDYLEARFGLRLSRQYLAKLAHSGAGPAYRRIGRATVYSTGDIDAWVNDRSSSKAARAADLVTA